MFSFLPAFGQEKEKISISSYEDVAGKNKIELENEFASTVQEGISAKYPFSEAGYEKAGGRFYMKKGTEYGTAQIRNDSYAVRKGRNMVPLLNSSYPQESVMTLFTTPSAAKNFSITIHHHKYGFVEEVFTVNLADLIASCMEAGCVPFVGIEENTRDSIKASVFLVNTTSGYNHILKVLIPVSLLKGASDYISADLYTYIPTHNISDLYAQ